MIGINRVWVALFLFLAISLICLGKLSAKDTGLLPKLVVDSTIHDYGEVMKGEKISYDFLIKNIGKGNLIIKKAQPD